MENTQEFQSEGTGTSIESQHLLRARVWFTVSLFLCGFVIGSFYVFWYYTRLYSEGWDRSKDYTFFYTDYLEIGDKSIHPSLLSASHQLNELLSTQATRNYLILSNTDDDLYKKPLPLFKYNSINESYEVLIDDLTALPNLPEELAHFGREGESGVRHTLKLLSASEIGFLFFTVTSTDWRGVQNLYYLDTEQPEKGFTKVDMLFPVPNNRFIMGLNPNATSSLVYIDIEHGEPFETVTFFTLASTGESFYEYCGIYNSTDVDKPEAHWISPFKVLVDICDEKKFLERDTLSIVTSDEYITHKTVNISY